MSDWRVEFGNAVVEGKGEPPSIETVQYLVRRVSLIFVITIIIAKGVIRLPKPLQKLIFPLWTVFICFVSMIVKKLISAR